MNRAAPLQGYSGDALLLGFSVALISIGLIAIASASIEYSDFHFGNPWHHAERHTLYLLLGPITDRGYGAQRDAMDYQSESHCIRSMQKRSQSGQC